MSIRLFYSRLVLITIPFRRATGSVSLHLARKPRKHITMYDFDFKMNGTQYLSKRLVGIILLVLPQSQYHSMSSDNKDYTNSLQFP